MFITDFGCSNFSEFLLIYFLEYRAKIFLCMAIFKWYKYKVTEMWNLYAGIFRYLLLPLYQIPSCKYYCFRIQNSESIVVAFFLQLIYFTDNLLCFASSCKFQMILPQVKFHSLHFRIWYLSEPWSTSTDLVGLRVPFL